MKKSLLVWAVLATGLAAMFYLPTSGGQDKSQVKPKHPYNRPAAVTKPQSIEIAWAGDLTPGWSGGQPVGDGHTQLAWVRKILSAADLSFANLEGTLGNGSSSKCGGGGNCFAFQADPQKAHGLAGAGLDVLGLANNHALDYGPAGQNSTIRALQSQQLDHAGLPGQITITKARGLRVAWLAFAPYPWASNLLAPQVAADQVRRAARRADLVMVYIHAGAEGQDRDHTPTGSESAFGENRGNSRMFARLMIKSGADAVVGSGPHVIRGMECYQGRPIAYSLGNFAGWGNFSLSGPGKESVILKIKMDRLGNMLGAQAVPLIMQGPGIPTPDQSGSVMQHLNALSRSDFSRPLLVGPNGRAYCS